MYLGHIYYAFIRVVVIIMKWYSTSIVLLEPIMRPYSIHINTGDWIRI
jgi:hypothetical protein